MTKGMTKKEIVWKSEYLVNVQEIDEEHQKLFEMSQYALKINELFKNNKDKEELKKVISQLFMYTKSHFAHEQNYMKSINYPDLDNHTLMHKNMVDSLLNLAKNIKSMDYLHIEDKLYEFIEQYFLHHIITEDKKISFWNTPMEEIKENFGWKEEYSVKNLYIDKDHKILFDIAKEAFDEVPNEQRHNKIKTVLIKLNNYMKTHFENEEKYMQELDYPLYDNHKLLHDNIIISLNEFIKRIPTLKLEDFEKELVKVIDITLLQHIILEDRKIIKWSEEL